MSDHIPFDLQSEIIKMLPVKSLVQFRSVSKQWKAFIDNPAFIKSYHVNHTNPQHHVLVQYELDTIQTYTSITDNNTFPHQKLPLNAPGSLRSLRNTVILGSIDGLLCFYGNVGSETKRAVIWNPTIRKSVGIVVIPKVGYERLIVGFGVCRDTSDPKLVKINLDKISCMWVVDVFTLSTRVWKTVYMGVPIKSCHFLPHQVFVDGVIYFRAWDDLYLDDEVRSNFVIWFDFKSEKFGKVCLPEKLLHTPELNVMKVNESLGLLEYYYEGDIKVCDVWSRKDCANNLFTKLYTIKVGCKWYNRVLGFRNNGEVVMELDANSYEKSRIEVYKPLSGHTHGVGINGKMGTFYAGSYMESLLLLDESDSTIH